MATRAGRSGQHLGSVPVGVLALLVLLVAWWAASTEAEGSARPTASTVAVPPEPGVELLVVAPEARGGYDRDRFEHWIDADGDGCRTRCEVLAEERRADGAWLSVYDGAVVTSEQDLEIDHLVALAEAWRSGARGWDDARRAAFANDLDFPDALLAVTSATNQSKADHDPARWRPPRTETWCWYARSWIGVKARWGLTADQAEVDALAEMLATC